MVTGAVFGNMTLDEFIATRKAMGFTQAGMANEIGLGARAYSSVETGDTPLKRRHVMLMERVALHYLRDDPRLPTDIRRDALAFSDEGDLSRSSEKTRSYFANSVRRRLEKQIADYLVAIQQLRGGQMSTKDGPVDTTAESIALLQNAVDNHVKAICELDLRS